MALQDNLVAYYKLDGNSNDSVGSNNGTDTNVSYVAGKIGDGSSVSSANGRIVANFPAPTSNWTYNFWVKPSSIVAQQTLLNNWNFSTSVGRNLNVYMQASTGKVRVDIPYISDGVVTATDALSTTEYTMVTITRSGNTWTIYYNGTSNASASNSSTQEAISNCVIMNVAGAYNIPLSGVLDELGAWNRVLTGTEITELYNARAGITYPFSGGGSSNFFQLFN